MEKVIWAVWGPPDTDRAALRDRLVAHLAPILLDEPAVAGLAMAIDDPEADVAPPVPWPEGNQPLLALVSVWLPAYDHRGLVEEHVAALASEQGLRSHGYLVSESLYTDYGESPWSGPRDWPDGVRSPGVLTVGLLQRPPDHDRQAWIRHWHDVQSPESAELQPRTRYVRNLVVLALDDGPPLEGISSRRGRRTSTWRTRTSSTGATVTRDGCRPTWIGCWPTSPPSSTCRPSVPPPWASTCSPAPPAPDPRSPRQALDAWTP